MSDMWDAPAGTCAARPSLPPWPPSPCPTRAPSPARDRHRRHRLAARRLRPGPADGARAGAVLRRHGALQERAEHDDDDLRRARRDHGRLGPRRLLAGLRRRPRARPARRPAPVLSACRTSSPGRRQLADRAGHPVRGVPGAVLRDHRCAGLRRDRRPGPVRRLDRLRLGLDACVVYAPIAHWVFDLDRDGHAGGWLANRVGHVDFAGGMAVEICSGASALALALVRRHAGWASARTRCARTT